MRRIGIGIGVPRFLAPSDQALVLSWSPGITLSGETFTRTTTALQRGTNGSWSSAAINTKRDSHYRPRTNYVLQNNNFVSGSWAKSAGGAASLPVVTAAFAMGPDGNPTSATRVQFDLGGGNTVADLSYFLQSSTPMPIGFVTTGSIWAKTTDGSSKSLWMRAEQAGGGTVAVDGNWRLISVSKAANANRAAFQIGLRGGTGASLSADVLFFKGQLELGGVPTARIDTAASIVTVYDDRTMLLETARSNSLLWSRDLTNAAWTKVGTGTVTLTGTGLDGTANSASVLTDSDAAAIYKVVSTAVTVPADGATHAISFHVLKDTNNTRYPLLYAQISGGTVVSLGVHLDTQAGSIVTTNAAGTGTARVIDNGAWWTVEIVLTNNSTVGNTSIITEVDPARSTVQGVDNVAATGAVTIGNVQVELNSFNSSSPIFTTIAAVLRDVDKYDIVGPASELDMSVFLQCVDKGNVADAANAPRYWTQAGAVGDAEPWILARITATGFLESRTSNAATNRNSTQAAAPVAEQVVDILTRYWASDGSIENLMALDLGAPTSGGRSAAGNPAAAWSTTKLSLGSNTSAAHTNHTAMELRSFKILAGAGWTPDTARAA